MPAKKVAKKAAFGGACIRTDANLAPIFKVKEGTLVPLGQMNKKIWEYIKENDLKAKME